MAEVGVKTREDILIQEQGFNDHFHDHHHGDKYKSGFFEPLCVLNGPQSDCTTIFGYRDYLGHNRSSNVNCIQTSAGLP